METLPNGKEDWLALSKVWMTENFTLSSSLKWGQEHSWTLSSPQEQSFFCLDGSVFVLVVTPRTSTGQAHLPVKRSTCPPSKQCVEGVTEPTVEWTRAHPGATPFCHTVSHDWVIRSTPPKRSWIITTNALLLLRGQENSLTQTLHITLLFHL